MTLADRMQRPTPFGWGGLYFYSYRGESWQTKSLLIRHVVERYATRYGITLTVQDAQPLYERLARKYGNGVGWHGIMKSLRVCGDADHVSHPRPAVEADRAAKEEQRQRDWRFHQNRMDVLAATDEAKGAFCVIDSIRSTCQICCGPRGFTMQINGEIERVLRGYGKRYYSVCRSPFCKAVDDIYGNSAGFPALKLLKELTKNGDRSKVRERLAQAVERHSRSATSGRHRQAKSQDHCVAC